MARSTHRSSLTSHNAGVHNDSAPIPLTAVLDLRERMRPLLDRDSDALPELVGLAQKVWHDRYAARDETGAVIETTFAQTAERVAAGIAMAEQDETRRLSTALSFYRELASMRFVPAGRILSTAGLGLLTTYFNCYVIPLDGSSRGGVMAFLKSMIDTMARGGGVGGNFSSVPPAGTPWALDEVQPRGGSARNSAPPVALLSVSHPDVAALIDMAVHGPTLYGISADKPAYTALTVGIVIDAEFQQALASGGSYTQRFSSDKHQEERTVVAADLWATIGGAAARGLVTPIFASTPAQLSTALAALGCALLPSPEDSRGGIVDSLHAVWLARARGERPAILFDTLRPMGAYIKSVNGRSSGMAAWLHLFNAVAAITATADPTLSPGPVALMEICSIATGKVIDQGGSRRGALMVMLDDTHPDIEEFITAKQIGEGGVPVRIQHANMSICVSDTFMSRLAADDTWTTHWGDTDMATKPASDLWQLVCERAHASAEPGVVFMERYQKMSNTWYTEEIRCVNPCVTGDTLIYTASGLYPARELAEMGMGVTVASPGKNGVAFQRASHVFSTGVKPVFRLQTQEGYAVRLTADHRVLTVQGWKEARHLRPGDRVKLLDGEGGFGAFGSAEMGRVLGWLVGDGAINPNRPGSVILAFRGSERVVAPAFAEAVNRLVVAPEGARGCHVAVQDSDEHCESRVESARLLRLIDPELLMNRLQVPPSVFRGSRQMQQGFLQALFSANGTISGSAEQSVTVRLPSSSAVLLEGVQQLLLNFGIAARLYHHPRLADAPVLPNGADGQGDHELVIGQSNAPLFAAHIGFMHDDMHNRLIALLDGDRDTLYAETYTATFSALIPDGEEEVFDLTEPVAHLFIGNGLTVHNCGEQGLGPWGVCNLGHINLAQFVSAEGSLDMAGIARSVRIAVRFLDDVIDANYYFSDENRRAQQEGIRRIGLGTMGLADMLIKMGVRYGSAESLRLIDDVYRVIRDSAYEESGDLALEKGAFPRFDAEQYAEGVFIRSLPSALQARIRAQGIRNGVLLSQAPTGTTSLLANVSSGIEPVFDFAMKRRDRLGEHTIYHPLLAAWMAEHPAETTPAYFVGAKQLTPREHVQVQARVQAYTDASISKTTNAPFEHTVDDVDQLYREAYTLGCKGVTYYRDGSRDAVLTSIEPPAPPAASAAPQESAATEQKIAELEAQVLTLQEMLQRISQPRQRGEWLEGVTRNIATPEGKANVTINSDEEGPLEVFINVGRAGSDITALAEAIGRLISHELRLPSVMTPADRLRAIASQLAGIGGSRSIGFGPNRVISLPDAIARALLGYLDRMSTMGGPKDGPIDLSLVPMTTHQPTLHGNGHSNGHTLLDIATNTAMAMRSGNICPECGYSTLLHEDGCKKCHSCGYSEC